MKLEICAAKATQTSVPEMGQEAKDLYYLIIGEVPNHLTINVGKKTYEKVAEMVKKAQEAEATDNKPTGTPKPPKP